MIQGRPYTRASCLAGPQPQPAQPVQLPPGAPVGIKCLVFLLLPYPMLGMMMPQPLNFLRTLESIPFGLLHDSCRRPRQAGWLQGEALCSNDSVTQQRLGYVGARLSLCAPWH